jgi:steroid 5-alpha reductase family enzyme
VIHYRMLLLSSVVTLWGCRLTFNFWRKDGYGTFFTHEEDYRWPILRKKMHPIVFLIFNFSFIAVYQNLLLFWIAVPAFEVIKGPSELAVADLLVAGLFSAFLLMETVADEQHWVFQSLKHSILPEDRDKLQDPQLRRGFFQSGLFKYSRHPNYFAEQSMWLCVYLYSITPTLAAGLAASLPLQELVLSCLNWTGLGCVQLMLLFQGSMAFGESITLSKYPAYKEYQATTSMCIPFFPAKAKSAKKDE